LYRENGKKESVIESLHRARLEQWIGDFDEAEKIYDEILSSDDRMVIYLKPAIEEKKTRMIADFLDHRKVDQIADFQPGAFDELIYADQIVFKKIPEIEKMGSQRPSLPLITEKEIRIQDEIDSKWKYSIIASAKTGGKIRFEIRGYSKVDREAKLNNVSRQMIRHKIDDLIFTPLEQQKPDAICINASLGTERFIYYVEVDSWGALRGEAIVSENKIQEFLEEQNDCLNSLQQMLWER